MCACIHIYVCVHTCVYTYVRHDYDMCDPCHMGNVYVWLMKCVCVCVRVTHEECDVCDRSHCVCVVWPMSNVICMHSMRYATFPISHTYTMWSVTHITFLMSHTYTLRMWALTPVRLLLTTSTRGVRWRQVDSREVTTGTRQVHTRTTSDHDK